MQCRMSSFHVSFPYTCTLYVISNSLSIAFAFASVCYSGTVRLAPITVYYMQLHILWMMQYVLLMI